MGLQPHEHFPGRPQPSWLSRAAALFETMSRPGLLISALIILFYVPTLGRGLLLDDLHHFALMQEYHDGTRDRLDLYQFLQGDESNAAARRRGMYVWWLGDDVKYRHWRPVGERLLYGQFTLFGRDPVGYRIVNLVMYIAGTLLVLRLLRRIGGDERAARWGALAFALFACHAIPVTFISAQGDPLSLVLICLAVLGSMQFTDRGGAVALVSATAAFALSLGVKEACLPVAAAPVLIAWFDRRKASPEDHDPRRLRRAMIASSLWLAIGLAWLGFYVNGGFGSNTLAMLNPAGDPLGYLAALPLRTVLLLSALVVPVNPFLFYLRPAESQLLLYAFTAFGAAAIGLALWKWIWPNRRVRGVAAMALWTVMFLPLLVCTVPDDRVMMLPGVGFSLLAGIWLARAAAATSGSWIRTRWPILVFLVLHPVSILFVNLIMGVVERKGNEALLAAEREFGREIRSGDCMFFLNSTLDSNVLFVQTRFESVTGFRHAYAAFLTDVENPKIHRVDARTLRLSSADGCLFDSFLGMMSQSRERPKREGDEFSARELTGRITKVENGCVKEVEIRFDQPLDSDSYRFYLCGELGMPQRWHVPALGQEADRLDRATSRPHPVGEVFND